MDETGDANIMPVERPQGAMLEVLAGHRLLEVGVGSDALSQRFAGCPEGMMGAYEEGRVVRTLREVQTLLRYLCTRL